MCSRVPDHPALEMLSQNPQGAEEGLTQVTQSRVDDEQTANSSSHTSTIAASASRGATQSEEGRKNPKRKTPDEPESYEVEKILGHRQDNQARNQSSCLK
jgi:hypothetical protein